MSRAFQRALIVMFLHLEQMEKAGVPVVDALASARDETSDRKIRAALDGALSQVKAGHGLTESLSFYPKIFDETMLGLIKTGEKSGKLARVLGLCLDYVRRRDEHARIMSRATRQPKISAVIILLLSIVERHSALPEGAAAIFALIIAVILGRRMSYLFRHMTDRFFLILPTFGRFVSEDSWARFASSLAMLYEAGIDLRSGIATAAESVPNLVIRDSIEQVPPRLSAGVSVLAAFREAGRMDRLALAMIKAGEDTGNLSETLRELAEFYEKRTADALTAVQQLSGPVLTIITGAILMFWV